VPPGLHSDFNSLATEYAQFRTAYSDELFRSIFEYARLRPGADVLDLACGTGLSMMPFLQRGCQVTGVDIAPAMLAVARQAVAGKFDVRFAIGKAEALPLENESFDLISCAQAFHWFDPDVAFAECARVLRPGGTLAIFWKHAARDDPYTLAGEDLIREWLGEAAALRSRDHAAEHEGFWSAVWRSVIPATGSAESPIPPGTSPALFREGERRVLSFMLPRTVDSFVGYQRSREKIRMVLGDRRHEFLTELEKRLRVLAPADGHFEHRQMEYLFLARRV